MLHDEGDESRRRAVEPPTWVIAFLPFVLAITTIIAFAGAVTVGVTWDEGAHVNILRTYFETGWHTAAPLINGAPDPAFFLGTYVYGPISELLPHMVAVITGSEQWWSVVSDSSDAYAARHVGVVVQGLIGVLAVGGGVGLIARSWRWGLVGAAILASIPLWTGHEMFNIKDTPPATGYVLFTTGVLGLLDSRYFRDRTIRIGSLLAITLGLVMAIGGRTGLTVLFVLTLPSALLILWLLGARGGRTLRRELRIPRRLIEGLAAFFVAYLALVLVYPNAFLNPVEVGIKSLLDSALFPMNEAQLTNGVWMVQPVGWTYLPTWFAAQLPLLVLIPALGVVVWWIAALLRGLVDRRTPESSRWLTGQISPIVAQAFAAPLAAIIGSSTLYNGTRQMLFVIPAAAMLAAIGLSMLWSWLARRHASGARFSIARTGFWLAVSAGLIVPVLAQIQLFPYGYTYYNGPAALKPIDGNWPTDYWRASGRELLHRLPPTGPVSCGYEQLMKGEFYPCDEQPMFTPFLNERGKNAIDVALQPNQYWFLRENLGLLEMPPGCTLVESITRPLLWQSVTIGQIAVCDRRIDTGVVNAIDPTKPAASD